MKNLFFLTISLFFSAGTFPQTDDALKYAETITQSGLKKQLTIIASAEMEGRETGTEGQRKAAAYIESQFKEIGLKYPESLKGYQQHYPLFKDTLIPKSLKIGKEKLMFGKDYLLQPGSSEESEFKSDDIIFAGYGIEDKNYNDYAGKNVKSKVVLIFNGEPEVNEKYLVSGTDKRSTWGYSIARKAALAKEKGAVAVLLINSSWDSIPFSLAQNSRKTNVYFPHLNEKERLTVVTLIASSLKNIVGENDAAEMIEIVKSKGALNEINFDKKIKTQLAYKKVSIKSSASNVIGYVEGTDKKDEYVFLTAHYDHLGKHGDAIYYGADDDGSGTVSVIEMAQAFAKAKHDGHGPKRTVVFMTVSGEEKGLWGSEYYSDHPVFPLDKTTVDLNTDMIGRIDTERKTGDTSNYIYVIGHDKLSSDLPVLNEGVNNKYTHLTLDYKFDDPEDKERIYFRSDHYNFARKGVPILFFYDGMLLADYHKPTDTVDKINFALMEKRARFIFLTAWEIANRNDMLKRDIPLPAEVR
ncbi:MAG: M28 family peptidase [Bacteroidota bacterium]|nr:M28 family peptidase [Bacteroidota bacterium]